MKILIEMNLSPEGAAAFSIMSSHFAVAKEKLNRYAAIGFCDKSQRPSLTSHPHQDYA